MKECISIKTDYSLMKSLIQIKTLISFAKKNNFNTLGIIDDNLSGSMEFLKECNKKSIKPVIGLDIIYNDYQIILYAKSYDGLKKLFKLNTYLLDNSLNVIELTKYINDLIVLLPYESISLFEELSPITKDIFIGYKSKHEKNSSLIVTNKVIYFNPALALTKEDTKYIKYLTAIKDNIDVLEVKTDYSSNYIEGLDLNLITNLINIEMPKYEVLIPHYDPKIKDSYKFLETLAIKGLHKRLDGNITDDYKKRLLYELNVIKTMGYVDYFLIVYDYVKYAVKEGVLVGPGRGSAAGSLVTYSLGITAVDPLKYGLLFERFLNPERITMPDIDIDFDASRRDEVVEYVKNKYGSLNVLTIMTHGTFASRQALISLSKVMNVDISNLLPLINSQKTLKENLSKSVVKILNTNFKIKELYYYAFKIEGLKKHISTHAAGVVVSSIQVDDVIPIEKSGDTYITGYSMNYLEEVGLLKMDFLAIKDLTSISNILKIIPDSININNINLEDKEVLSKFTLASTTGIFQFESEGMKGFLSKLKPNSFNDLVVALALYRPGPMDNIDSFIKRREGKEKIDTIVPELEDVLKETYGIIVYQEQIMKIFTIVGSYTYAEADLIRRAISKKDEEVIKNEQDKFIKRAINNNYDQEKATLIYQLIMKFANYGFNKSHSVAYALVGYQMMYLKTHYKEEFYISLLNINIGSSTKTKEYIDEAKCIDIKFNKPDINLSYDTYIKEDGIRMPLNLIKNIGIVAANDIIKERENGLYLDFFDFVARTYNKNVNIKTIENLIHGGVFDSFNETRKTLIENINNAVIYAELLSGLDSSLVAKPNLIQSDEYSADELMNKELDLYNFYVSNHPASKYKEIKINTIPNYFDKIITTVGLLENIKEIKTKNNKPMAFLQISDETGKLDYTIFSNRIGYINQIKRGNLLKIIGRVEKRLDKYQIIVSTIEILK